MPTALITGAGGGIGSAIAAALAPTHTLLLAGRPSDRLDALAERLGATTFPLDMTDSSEIEAACEIVDALDVLVHNAGISIPGRVAESDVDAWRATFAVNVLGPVELTLALLPALRATRGRGVFTSLFRHLEALAAADAGICGMRLYVERHNEKAQAVYRRLGLDSAGYEVFGSRDVSHG